MLIDYTVILQEHPQPSGSCTIKSDVHRNIRPTGQSQSLPNNPERDFSRHAKVEHLRHPASFPCMAQPPRIPDLESQRAAMKKLGFLAGKWSGEARIMRSTGDIELVQTEDAQYRLDGLILMIEAAGRNKADGKLAMQAVGVVSFDDEAGKYHMRSWNDGRYLETEVKLAESGKGMTWGFALGDIKLNSSLTIDENGNWTELHVINVGTQPPRKFMELKVSPQR
jgi:hypothetical protein